MYADSCTTSMRGAVKEVSRRRRIQRAYNDEHGIMPRGIRKAIKDITDQIRTVAESRAPYEAAPVSKEQVLRLIKQLESQMKSAAKNLEFEKAAMLRDRIVELRKGEDSISP